VESESLVADASAASEKSGDDIVPTPAVFTGGLSAEAFLSLGSMEGVYEPVVAAPSVPIAPRTDAVLAPGYLFAAGVAVSSLLIHRLPIAPFTIGAGTTLRHPISAAIIAILLGLTLRNLLSLPQSIGTACKHIVKKMIPVAIVLMGAGLNLSLLVSIGPVALAITAACIGVALAAGYYFGRLFGLPWKTSLLLGTGTGICGNSAIVAVAPLIDAEDDDLVLSIGAVNLFGLLAMLAWPAVGGALGMGDQGFGVWTGTSIHAIPQVVAAGFAYSADAGTLATLVKLVRVTLLAPLVFVLAILYAKHHASEPATNTRFTVRYARLVPWFVWGFVVFAVLNTLGLLPDLDFTLASIFSSTGDVQQVRLSLPTVMTGGGELLLTLAMAAIGLDVNLRVLSSVGSKALWAGLMSTITLGAASLAMVWLLL
jgi:uncharacterized integral membrane protein (TIGR00698 family)